MNNIFNWFNRLMTNPSFYGQMSHVMGGYGIILTVALFSQSMLWTFISWVLLIGLTAYKEFWYDTHYEIPQQDIAGGKRDFIAYQIGAGVGLVVSIIHFL